jgi:hypothetical protein
MRSGRPSPLSCSLRRGQRWRGQRDDHRAVKWATVRRMANVSVSSDGQNAHLHLTQIGHARVQCVGHSAGGLAYPGAQ